MWKKKNWKPPWYPLQNLKFPYQFWFGRHYDFCNICASLARWLAYRFYVNLYLFNLYIPQYDFIGWYLWSLKHKLLPARIYFANKLSLNVAKTEFMVIGSRQKILAESYDDISKKLQDQVISRVDHVQSLGNDDRLTWSNNGWQNLLKGISRDRCL